VENVEPAGFWIRAAGRLIDWIPNWIAGAVAYSQMKDSPEKQRIGDDGERRAW
jgi:hypothetical protein